MPKKVILLKDRKKVEDPECVECGYCLHLPPEKPKMKTYAGSNNSSDSCFLYSEYGDIRDGIVGEFTLEYLIRLCREPLFKNYPDVPDIDKTIVEMLDIDFDLGMVEKVGDNLFRVR